MRIFARRNSLDGDGEEVSTPLAMKLLARHDALDELQRLNTDLQAGDIDSVYYRNSPHEEALAALQTLLHELGFDAELNWARYRADGDYGTGTTRAVNAFARQQGITSDGEQLTTALARRIVANLRPHYGDEWSTVTPIPAAAFRELRTREVQRGGKGTDQIVIARRSCPRAADASRG